MREAFDSQYVKEGLITLPNPWQMVDVRDSIDSTNAEALRDPQPWRVVVADFQSAGRGRMARQWQAPPGTSIAVSAVVPMPAGRVADVGWLPLMSGMAMRSALTDVAQVTGQLKWPNDVLVQEGAQAQEGVGGEWLKISGVLCECVPDAGLVVIGAGANVSQERSELAVQTATSLALCGATGIRREELVVRYLTGLAGLHRTWSAGGAGLVALRAAYRHCCLTIGLDVDVHQPGGQVVRGTATGVDDVGRLVVSSGRSSKAHAAGDVVHVRRVPPQSGRTA
jgi:BirA family transcriptional regulator, biotin operon repressor / biotin---[acetyl-CoA-carboxylase] ligase